MSVVGRPCAALIKGQWIGGVIKKHDVKKGVCIVETYKHGSFSVSVYRIRMTDKNDWD